MFCYDTLQECNSVATGNDCMHLALPWSEMSHESNLFKCLQVGGQQPRWQLYHQLYLIEHSGKRTTPLVKGPVAASPHDRRPASASALAPAPPLRPDHPLSEHVDWMLPTLLRVCACLHAIWTPQASPHHSALVVTRYCQPC